MRFSKGIISSIIAVSLLAVSSTIPLKPANPSMADTLNKPSSVSTPAENLNTANRNNTNSAIIPSNSTNGSLSLNTPSNSDSTTISTNNSSASNHTNYVSNAPATVQAPNAQPKQSGAVQQTPTPAPAPETAKPVSAPEPEAPKPAPPSRPTSSKLVLGYGTYYSSSDVSSLNSLKAHSSSIDQLATHTYIINTDGDIYIQNNVLPTSQISYANNNGIEALAVVRNEFNGALAHDVLNNPGAAANLINKIESALVANNYKGVNIDFELLYAKDREVFTNFMRDLYNRLKPKGYIVSIALPPKTSEVEKWVYAYDYANLGSYSDYVILMTYDEHYPGGAPGPIASINWTQRVVNYAASVIPRNKLLLGLAAYGYDWTITDGKTISTKSLSIQSAYKVASANGAQVLWDEAAQVPYYNYTDAKGSHSVYFENSTSISYKLNIVNNSNLRGIAIWRLGLEDADYWTTINAKLNN